MNTNIRLKDGSLSSYGLSCGYVESWRKNHEYFELYKEHNCFHVKYSKFNVMQSWTSFDNLHEARRHFYKLSKCPKL